MHSDTYRILTIIRSLPFHSLFLRSYFLFTHISSSLICFYQFLLLSSIFLFINLFLIFTHSNIFKTMISLFWFSNCLFTIYTNILLQKLSTFICIWNLGLFGIAIPHSNIGFFLRCTTFMSISSTLFFSYFTLSSVTGDWKFVTPPSALKAQSQLDILISLLELWESNLGMDLGEGESMQHAYFKIKCFII